MRVIHEDIQKKMGNIANLLLRRESLGWRKQSPESEFMVQQFQRTLLWRPFERHKECCPQTGYLQVEVFLNWNYIAVDKGCSILLEPLFIFI